jgi:tRNA pseudouridine38-40 synthase
LNYKVILSYDGNHFHGFQKQPSIITVQQVIEKALSNLLQNFEITYAGRTDAGVHAKHQVLSVVTDEKISESFKTSFNALVGKHIYIKQIKIAKESFIQDMMQ